MKKLFSRIAALALAGALLSGCAAPGGAGAASSAAGGPKRCTAIYYDVFDTVTTIIGYCDTEAEFNRQAEALHADLVRYNELFDIYKSYDGVVNLKTVNEQASAAPVAVDPEIIAMLKEAIRLYDTTKGKTNVAMGAVLRLWHDAREKAEADPATAALPDAAALEAAAAHCSISDIVLDEAANTVYLADPEMSLDVGSCGKGYACEQVCLSAEARGLKSALVSVGGNLRAIGEKPGGIPWTGGVEDPWTATAGAVSSGYLSAVNLPSGYAMVTSGDYQRYFTVGGVRYHHLIDPDTLFPARYANSVTVLCADSGLADCLSTGLFCMSVEDGQALIESLDGVEAYWCLSDGKTTVESSGWDAMVHQS